MDGRFVLLLLVLSSCSAYQSSAAALEPPKAIVYTYKNNGILLEKVELVESQKYSMKDVVLVLECNASYPIEWIVYYTKGTDEQNRKLEDTAYDVSETRRHTSSNFEDSNSYRYTAILETHYWRHYWFHDSRSANYTPAHFTCKATEMEGRSLQSHVYMTSYDGSPQLFSLELTHEYKRKYLDTSITFGEQETNCDDISFTISTSQSTKKLCWGCNGKAFTLGIFHRYCRTVTECKNTVSRYFDATQCLQKSNATSGKCVVPGTRTNLYDSSYYSQVAYCHLASSPAKVLQIVTFGMFLGDLRDEFAVPPAAYFNWNEVDPTQMLYIHPFGRERTYAGDEITIKCEYSRYYFSHGSWFAIRHPDGLIEYAKAFEKKPCHKDQYSLHDVRERKGDEKLVSCDWTVPWIRFNTFTATLKRKLEAVGRYEVFCIGPVWNTTEWVNVSSSITVTDLSSEKRAIVAMSVLEGDDDQVPQTSTEEALSELRIPNLNASFLLRCNATFPIEWIFQYKETYAENNEVLALAETRRHVVNFKDPSTYLYTAWVKVKCNGKLTSVSTFTCKSTSSSATELQTHVHVTNNGNTTLLKLNVVETNGKNDFQNQKEEEVKTCENSGNAGMLRYSQPKPYHICISCSYPHSALELRSCRTPIECNSIFAKNGQANAGVDTGGSCSPWQSQQLDDYNPKYLQCVSPKNGVAGLLFFGIAKNIPELDGKQGIGDEENERSSPGIPVYSNWQDINPSKMVYVHPITSHVLPNEIVEVKCEYSRFYFSLGSWFGIRHANGQFQYFPAVDVRPCDTDAERAEAALGTSTCNPSREAEKRGTFNATLTTKFEESGGYQIFCMGPVWNTTEWKSSSRFISVDKWDPPKVLSVAPVGNNTLLIGEEHHELKCDFRGHPKPNIRWITPPGFNGWNYTDGFSNVLSLQNISFAHFGTYKCYAESLNQSNFGEYTFTPEGETRTVTVGALSTASIVAIIVACLALLVVVTAVIARMRRTIAKQRKALRLLTDTEVKEFLEGSPVEVDTDRSDYISNIAAIDALPYDKKYEIPLDRLVIDYSSSLGSGEYGIILKAKLRPQKTRNYANLAGQFRAYENAVMLTGDVIDLPTQELEIAVKVCKKNLGIEPFKALLSEVKVMAYLGRNENILSLIGASTENIRNREIYIAEELCHNGSLDIFVKMHKKKYFNKVRRGRYLDDLEPRAPTSTGNQPDSDLQSPFSTTELIRWTRDIACGVEYIHSKRVIHGDLALRNVLITKNLVAKIGDFGLSRRLGEVSIYSKTTECPLPWRSMAIESLLHLQFSVKSDMWSLGVTLWELFTLGSIPYQGLRHNSDFIKELENGTLRLPVPHLAPSTICDFLLMCWENEPKDRPSTVEIKMICDSLIPPSTS